MAKLDQARGLCLPSAASAASSACKGSRIRTITLQMTFTAALEAFHIAHVPRLYLARQRLQSPQTCIFIDAPWRPSWRITVSVRICVTAAAIFCSDFASRLANKRGCGVVAIELVRGRVDFAVRFLCLFECDGLLYELSAKPCPPQASLHTPLSA